MVRGRGSQVELVHVEYSQQDQIAKLTKSTDFPVVKISHFRETLCQASMFLEVELGVFYVGFFFFLHFFIVFFPICRREIGYFQAFFNMTTVKKQNYILHFWDVCCSKVDRIISFLFIKKECCYYCLFLQLFFAYNSIDLSGGVVCLPGTNELLKQYDTALQRDDKIKQYMLWNMSLCRKQKCSRCQ